MNDEIKRCIYCQRAADSDEHIIGSWFFRELESIFGRPIPGGRLEKGGAVSRIPVSRNSKGKRQFDFTTDLICHQCNNEWMNRMDEAVRRYMIGLLRGRTTVCNKKMQRGMASWAVKTAITARFAHVNPDPVEGQWAKQLMKDKRPSTEWAVWLARYKGKQEFWFRQGEIDVTDASRVFSTSERPPTDLPLSKNGVVMTLVLGELCVQVARVNGPERIFNLGDPAVLRIWPSGSDGSWPPSQELDDSTLEAFASRFYTAGLGLVREVPRVSGNEEILSRPMQMYSSSPITEEALSDPTNFVLTISEHCGQCGTDFSLVHDAGRRLAELEFPYSVSITNTCPGCGETGTSDIQLASIPDQWRQP